MVMEGTQAEQTSLHPRDSPEHSSRWVCGLRQPGPHLQAPLSSQHSRRLPGAICLHYAGLFGEVSDGRLSWLREGLIYRQMCFEGLLKVALLQIRARQWQPRASPGRGEPSVPWEDWVRAEPLNFALLHTQFPFTIQSVFIEHLL